MTVRVTRYPRRAILRGIVAAGGVLMAGGVAAACGTAATPATLRTARQFLAGERYSIAHRGAGDEAPEHTLAAYTRILDRGAEAIEISVHRTSDGVLVCHHDPDLARTCNGFLGEIASMTFADLSKHQVDMRAYLGPGWAPQPIPRLDAVLDEIGGRAILFVEPKDPTAAGDVIAMVVARKLQDSTVFKQHYKGTADAQARAADMAVWNYYDRDTPASAMAAIAARSDAIGAEANEPFPDDRMPAVVAAVATGKPVIGWALHRRSLLDQLAAVGVRGFMCSDWSYLTATGPGAPADTFATGRVAPGDLPVDSTTDAVPRWDPDGVVSLVDKRGPQSVVMGSMSPIVAPTYTLSFQMRFDALPPGPDQHAGIVIGRASDTPYRFRSPDSLGGGRQVILRADGTLELRDVPFDNGQSALITSKPGDIVRVGRWESVSVLVKPQSIAITRTPDGGPAVKLYAKVSTPGQYFVISRNYNAPDASVAFRKITTVLQ